MSIETIIWIWLAGSIVALPRLIASFYEIDEKYIDVLPPSPIHLEFLFSLLSWLSVATGIIMFFMQGEKYFWKISKKGLWKKYNERKLFS